MNTKRILVFVMTLVMLLSAFVPTISVFAEENHDSETQSEAKFELDYLSLIELIGMNKNDTSEFIDNIKNISIVVMDFITEQYENAYELGYDDIKDYLAENADALYNENMGVSKEVYDSLVSSLIDIMLYVEENDEAIVNKTLEQYFVIVEKLVKVYGAPEIVIEKATDVYFYLRKIALEFDGDVEEIAIKAYAYAIDVVYIAFGDMATAEKIASDILYVAIEFLNNSPELSENAQKLYNDIYEIITGVYGETESIKKTAEAVYKYVYELAVGVKNDVSDVIYGASNGNYVLYEDSYYLALGNAGYADELANMLTLGDKYAQYGLDEDYIEALSKADLVTIKFNNGEFDGFAKTQVLGKLAEIISGNEILTYYYNFISPVKKYFEEDLGMTLESRPVEIDWSKYLDEESNQLRLEALARLRAELIACGLPEYTDIAPIINKNILSVYLPSVKLRPLYIPTADLVMFAIDNLLYSYAEAVARIKTTVETVYELAPDATVVITSVSTPKLQFPDEYSAIFEGIVGALNANLYGLALAREKTIFVNSESAEDIYNALNSRCGHAYDDCEDTICNMCGETRDALEHNFADYIYNNDATCGVDGTKSAVCTNCGKISTVVAQGTALDHEFGDWVKNKSENKAERTCKHCGFTEEMPLDDSPVIIVGIFAITIAISTAVVLYMRAKKKEE